MSASNAKGILSGAARQLHEAWHETRAAWLDQKAREFGAEYIESLDASLITALRAIEDLDKLLHQIHADCE